MIRTIVVDDEQHARENLKSVLIANCPQVKVVAEADSVETAVSVIQNESPDLVFMDIDLSDGSGFNVIEQLNACNFELVFVTAYDQYAIKAFKYNALDYILKPINAEEVKKVVEKIESKSLQKESLVVRELIENLSRSEKDRKIAIPDREGISFVLVSDIIRCQSDNNYTNIFLKGGKKFMVSKTLKEYADLLPETMFFRVHQSHLVNLSCVNRFVREEGGYLIMEDGSQLEIARRRKDELLLRLS